MKNADMPVTANIIISSEMCLNDIENIQKAMRGCGLTKREELAARNMAAILSSIPHWDAMGYIVLDDSDYAKQAIDAADALLMELDK